MNEENMINKKDLLKGAYEERLRMTAILARKMSEIFNQMLVAKSEQQKGECIAQMDLLQEINLLIVISDYSGETDEFEL